MPGGNLPEVTLSGRERAVLDLEGSWWTTGATKSSAIRTRLGMSPARYYRVLAGLVEREEALAYDPLVVHRVRRMRSRRRRARVEGRPATTTPGR